jgi:hypothetical protein
LHHLQTDPFNSARASLIMPDGFENTFLCNHPNHWSWIHSQSHRKLMGSLSINDRNTSGKRELTSRTINDRNYQVTVQMK